MNMPQSNADIKRRKEGIFKNMIFINQINTHPYTYQQKSFQTYFPPVRVRMYLAIIISYIRKNTQTMQDRQQILRFQFINHLSSQNYPVFKIKCEKDQISSLKFVEIHHDRQLIFETHLKKQFDFIRSYSSNKKRINPQIKIFVKKEAQSMHYTITQNHYFGQSLKTRLFRHAYNSNQQLKLNQNIPAFINNLLQLFVKAPKNIFTSSNIYLKSMHEIEINCFSLLSYKLLIEETKISAKEIQEIQLFIDPCLLERDKTSRFNYELNIRNLIALLLKFIARDEIDIFEEDELPKEANLKTILQFIDSQTFKGRMQNYLDCEAIRLKIERAQKQSNIDLMQLFRYTFCLGHNMNWQCLIQILINKLPIVDAVKKTKTINQFNEKDAYQFNIEEQQVFMDKIHLLIWSLMKPLERGYFIENGFNTEKLIPLIYFDIDLGHCERFQTFHNFVKSKEGFSPQSSELYCKIIMFMNQIMTKSHQLEEHISRRQTNIADQEIQAISLEQQKQQIVENQYKSSENQSQEHQKNKKTTQDEKQTKELQQNQNKSYKQKQMISSDDFNGVEQQKIKEEKEEKEQIYFQGRKVVQLKRVIQKLSYMMMKSQIQVTRLQKNNKKKEVSRSVIQKPQQFTTILGYFQLGRSRIHQP